MTQAKSKQAQYLPAGTYDAPRISTDDKGNIVAVRQRRYILKDAWEVVDGNLMRRVDRIDVNSGEVTAENALVSHSYLESRCVPVNGGKSFAEAQALMLDHNQHSAADDVL